MTGDEGSAGAAGGGAGLGIVPLMVVVIVVVAVIGGYFAYSHLTGPDINPNEVSVTLKVNYGNGTVLEESVVTENNTPLGVLEAFVGYENLDIGGTGADVFLNGINGVTTGSVVPGITDTSAHYWMWYLNGTIVWEAANAYEVFDGSEIEWRFQTF